MNTKHVPVLLEEVIENLDIKPGQTIVDATLGGGGHLKQAISEAQDNGKFFAFDVDRRAIENFAAEFGKQGFETSTKDLMTKIAKGNLEINIVNENFSKIGEILKNEKVDRIYADLGFSTDQLDEDLSFKKPGELDLRMDKRLVVKAKDLLNGMYEKEIVNMLEENGDEPLAKQIAKQIVLTRKNKVIDSKTDLAKIIDKVVLNLKSPIHSRKAKPHARVFQALRIAVNSEFQSLKTFLDQSFDLLKANGRIAVISFHSGEDRIVKKNFKNLVQSQKAKWVSEIIHPSPSEVRSNPKSSSATLRVIEKI